MTSPDPSDDLHDAALAEDIALLGDMMAAAAKDAGRELTQAEVDEALGLPAAEGPSDATREPDTPRRTSRRRKGPRLPRSRRHRTR